MQVGLRGIPRLQPDSCRYRVARVSLFVLTGLRFLIALPVPGMLYWTQPAPHRPMRSSLHLVLAVTGMALMPGLIALVFYY